MGRQPERTCIGCRQTFPKEQVVRIAATPGGAVIDYREKLPGRAAYVCPTRACIAAAFAKNAVSRSLRASLPVPDAGQAIRMLSGAIETRVHSLLLMALKAGKARAGYSAVADGVRKGSVRLLLYAEDLSSGTKEKIDTRGRDIPAFTLFTKDEIGSLFGREAVGVVAIDDEGLSNAVAREAERLKGLRNAGK